MPLALDQSPVYVWTVEGELPGADGPAPFAFEAEFRRLPQAALDAAAADPPPDAEWIGRIFAGWRSGITEGGREVACTPETRERLLNLPGVRAAIIRAHIDSLTKGRAGN